MTERRPGTIKHAGAYRKKIKPQQEKPCPTCYRVMRWVGPDEWECVTHGKPDRE